MGRARQIASAENQDRILLDASAASTDEGEFLLLDASAAGTDAGFFINTEDGTGDTPFRNLIPDGSITGARIESDPTISGALTVTGAVTADAGISVDNITIDGTEIDISSGSLTIDAATNIILDADGGEVQLKDAGTEIASLQNSSSDFKIESKVSDKDIIFGGNDGGSGIEVARFDVSRGGEYCMGVTSGQLSTQADVHLILSKVGFISATAADQASGYFSRNNDGIILIFYNNGTSQGSINVSGTTVSYNAFTGSHPSRLSDNSKPTILKGTILETIDELMDWYQLEFKMSPDANTSKVPYLKPSDKNVNDTVSYTHTDGKTYTATIKQKGDEKHVKCKISDTADSSRVYGVFHYFDEEDIMSADGVNDINIAAVGTYPVRIHKDQTVSAGDLLVSNGDGTAKKQADDIIRSKTIGKALTNVKTVTYSDGSYLVPCALYCG